MKNRLSKLRKKIPHETNNSINEKEHFDLEESPIISIRDYEIEKDILDYCKDVFDREMERRNSMDKKAQFYFSFLSAILGALFINLENLNDVIGSLSAATTPKIIRISGEITLYVLGGTLLLSILITLISTRLKKYICEYPPYLPWTLYSPNSDFNKDNTPAKTVRFFSEYYNLAMINHARINDKIGFYLAVICIFIIVGLYIFLNV